eukprot:scaffold4077_cov257-Pinguiococcus_pyrenoidosus.AAC.4
MLKNLHGRERPMGAGSRSRRGAAACPTPCCQDKAPLTSVRLCVVSVLDSSRTPILSGLVPMNSSTGVAGREGESTS